METEFIQWLGQHLRDHEHSPLPWGDDAAILTTDQTRCSESATSFAPLQSQVVVTTDLLSDGTDFRLGEVDPRRIGRKAVAVNLSDLAAMAAKPIGILISLALPRRIPELSQSPVPNPQSAFDLAVALYEGMLPLCEDFKVPIVGGDTNSHDGPLVISGTALGAVTHRGPLTRRGGNCGDRLLITGHLGGSISGHHLDFTPRVREALLLHEHYDIHAGMDISDGLALDASRLATASGCGAVIELDRLPISPAVRDLGHSVQRALEDGEDFELLLALPPAEAERLLRDAPVDCGVTDIGELTAEPGLWQRAADGTLSNLPPAGFLH